MVGNRRRDSAPEVALRRVLHRSGRRFRVDFPIHVPGRRAIRPDIVFTRARLAVFVDGCFWHGCLEHGTRPRVNEAYWAAKIEMNQARDIEQTRLLEEFGWAVLRSWEHEPPDRAALRVMNALGAQAASGSGADANCGSRATPTA